MKHALSVVKSLGVAVLLIAWSATAWAEAAAVVMNLSGTASVQRADGRMGVLARDSELAAGDVIQTEERSKVLLRFSDGAMVTVRSNSRILIESYNYDEANPEADNTALNLLKGGMRAISGAVGKRGNKDAYSSRNFASTIGIRGTGYIVRACVSASDSGMNDCQSLRVPAEMVNSIGNLVDGLYFTVTDGVIVITNATGSYDFTAGQSGYIRDFDSQPKELTEDPGLQLDYLESLSGFGAPRRFGSGPEFCLVR